MKRKQAMSNCVPLGGAGEVYRVALWREKKKINENKEGDEDLNKVGSAQTGLIGVNGSPIPRNGKEHHRPLSNGV